MRQLSSNCWKRFEQNIKNNFCIFFFIIRSSSFPFPTPLHACDVQPCIDHIICTNTHPSSSHPLVTSNPHRFTVLDVSDLFARAIYQLFKPNLIPTLACSPTPSPSPFCRSPPTYESLHATESHPKTSTTTLHREDSHPTVTLTNHPQSCATSHTNAPEEGTEPSH